MIFAHANILQAFPYSLESKIKSSTYLKFKDLRTCESVNFM